MHEILKVSINKRRSLSCRIDYALFLHNDQIGLAVGGRELIQQFGSIFV